jgi:tRNA(Ile)-lysidine synthase
MRQGSAGDLAWVTGLCRAWQVPLRTGRASPPPASEEEAREARYDFLLDMKGREEAEWILTGHQADDQAETVLFRMLRGTGLRGLAGIPVSRAPGLYRPLLAFTRAELRAYARDRGLRGRDDPTNLDPTIPRNYLRHEIIPRLEEGVAPGARRALRRLARLARENERAWAALVPRLLNGMVQEEDDHLLVARRELLDHSPGVQVRLLREILERQGITLDAAGTRAVVEFTRTGASGRSLTLPGGYRLAREFDRFRIGWQKDSPKSGTLAIQGTGTGSGEVRIGGARFWVEWWAGGTERSRDPMEREMAGEEAAHMAEGWDRVTLPARSEWFPLTLRGWEEGDRIRLTYGTKRLAKLFGEARIPVEGRGRVPVLLEVGGEVLWVAGVALSVLAGSGDSPRVFHLGIRNVDQT